MDRVLEVMIEAARAAGRVTLAHFHRGVDATLKSDRSPVTVADREGEEIIVSALRRAFPDHGFLGEEFGAEGPSARRFIIDPIDGTRNFVRGIPHWATLIAREEAGQVTAGVVFQPVTGDLHAAAKGQGAFLNGERIRVSTIATAREATLVHGTLNLLRQSPQWEAFVDLVDATGRQRGFGDYLCFTTVAEGKAELGISLGVKAWDLAPLKLLLEEAGGLLTDFEGTPSISSGVALATNGLLHDLALRMLRRDQRETVSQPPP
jgi:histidinol-phosphatase